MSGERGLPRFVDEHRIVVDAPRDRVWAATRDYYERSIVQEGGSPFLRFLRNDPPTGFAVAAEVPGERLELEGSHRFSRFRLIFELRDEEGGTALVARSLADFPGFSGFVYRALVIGSGGHAVIVRGMLRSIARSSRAA